MSTILYLKLSDFHTNNPNIQPEEIGLKPCKIFGEDCLRFHLGNYYDMANRDYVALQVGLLAFGKHEIAQNVQFAKQRLAELLAAPPEELPTLQKHIEYRKQEASAENSQEYLESVPYLESLRWFVRNAYYLEI